MFSAEAVQKDGVIPTRERLAALLLALVPALALSQEDPTVVQVGKVSYPLSVVSFSLQSALDLAQSLGEVTQEDVQTAKEETIERFIGMGIIENQLMRAGRNDFSDSEKELLMAQPAVSMTALAGVHPPASAGGRGRHLGGGHLPAGGAGPYAGGHLPRSARLRKAVSDV